MKATLLAHAHNKIVHFPLALGLAAAVLLIVSRRWPAYDPTGRVLLLVAAVAAVAAYFTGRAQEEPFEDGPLHDILEWHERMGITTGISLWVGVVLGAVQRTRRWLWLYGVALIALLAITGFLGGVLSHGELH